MNNLFRTPLVAFICLILLIACKKDSHNDNNNNNANNQSPTCNISAPATNASFTTDDPIEVLVGASDADGSIAEVRLIVEGTTYAAVKTSAPYNFTIEPGTLETGSHTIKAIAKDNKGATAETTLSVNIIAHTPAVYISGYEFNASGISVAKYWKDGSEILLSDGSRHAMARAVFVTPNDVFAAGYQINAGGKSVVTYWKNGAEVAVTNGATFAGSNSIFISGNDVFVGGYENNTSGISIGKYWKNGTEVVLTSGVKNGSVFSVVESGNDVFAIGFEDDEAGKFKAKY